MLSTMNDLERELRRSAKAARQAPSPQLRRRTLTKLQDQQVGAVSPAARSWQKSLAALAMLMISLGAFAYLQQDRAVTLTAVVTNQSPNRPHAPRPSLPKFSIPQVEVAIAAPLKNEFELITRDAERTVEYVRHELARLPRLESFSPSARHDDVGSDTR